jgi:hypothetical protein
MVIMSIVITVNGSSANPLLVGTSTTKSITKGTGNWYKICTNVIINAVDNLLQAYRKFYLQETISDTDGTVKRLISVVSSPPIS